MNDDRLGRRLSANVSASELRNNEFGEAGDQLEGSARISYCYSVEPALELLNVALNELSETRPYVSRDLIHAAPGSSGTRIAGTKWFAFSWHSLCTRWEHLTEHEPSLPVKFDHKREATDTARGEGQNRLLSATTGHCALGATLRIAVIRNRYLDGDGRLA